MRWNPRIPDEMKLPSLFKLIFYPYNIRKYKKPVYFPDNFICNFEYTMIFRPFFSIQFLVYYLTIFKYFKNNI